jgi:membrane protein DedA with SNARE-associated domain
MLLVGMVIESHLKNLPLLTCILKAVVAVHIGNSVTYYLWVFCTGSAVGKKIESDLSESSMVYKSKVTLSLTCQVGFGGRGRRGFPALFL